MCVVCVCVGGGDGECGGHSVELKEEGEAAEVAVVACGEDFVREGNAPLALCVCVCMCVCV